MADNDIARSVPHSIDAEKAILGNIIIDQKLYENVSFLKPEDFYLDAHRHIFDAISELIRKGKVVDTVTLCDALKEQGNYSFGDANKYIMNLVESAAQNTNVEAYALIIRNKAILRQLIDASRAISDSAYSEVGDVADIIDQAESSIYAISSQKYSAEFIGLRDLLMKNYEELQHRANNPNERFGIQTYYSGLDETLVGLGPGDLVIIGARPGMGKTSFAMNIACDVAKFLKKTVAIFSLEMTALQLSSRLLGSEALVPSKVMLNGKLTTEEWKRLADACSALSNADILINDSSDITVSEMKSKLRKVKDLGLVVIDYLQLMHDSKYTDNRVLEVAQITRSLKIMAKELNVPVLLCSQLSRGPKETREITKPALTDLRDSGAIEQDADIVMFIHREEYYKAGERTDSELSDHETASIIIAKNRHGETKTVKLDWYGRYFRFFAPAEENENEQTQ